MYVIWITFTNGKNGYFTRYDDYDDFYYNESIYDARKFPSYTAAESIKEQLDRDWSVKYTEIVKYDH